MAVTMKLEVFCQDELESHCVDWCTFVSEMNVYQNINFFFGQAYILSFQSIDDSFLTFYKGSAMDSHNLGH